MYFEKNNIKYLSKILIFAKIFLIDQRSFLFQIYAVLPFEKYLCPIDIEIFYRRKNYFQTYTF